MTRNRTAQQKAIAKAKHEKRQSRYSDPARHEANKDTRKLKKLTEKEMTKKFRQKGLSVSKSQAKAFWEK